jgi:two-component system CheB/CheR fusion protein
VLVARDDTIREINHAAAGLLGIERSGIIGQKLSRYIAAAARGTYVAMLAAAFAAPERASCELEIETRRGVRMHVELDVAALVHEDALALIAIVDLSERKAKEEALALADASLRDAERRKDELLAALSHELRNPLLPIRNSLYVVEHTPPGDARHDAARTVIERQVDHLARLVDDLLDITRITRGKIELRRETVDLSELVSATVEDHRACFDASGIVLCAVLGSEPCWIDADPARIVQALSNVLHNAEKFTPRGGAVTVSLSRSGATAVLRVRDSGSGIPADVLPHVFEPFAQAPQPADRPGGGLGLGLALVRGLVELHGGQVGIASDGPGGGTEVTFALPLVAPPARARGVDPDPAFVRHRVLVLDDNIDSTDSLVEVLALLGHDTHGVYTGAAGLVAARTFRPDIVFCDLGLPDLHGYDVARALRADKSLRGPYLVALSGYAQPRDIVEARAAGFDEHLAKPATLPRIRHIVACAPVIGARERVR